MQLYWRLLEFSDYEELCRWGQFWKFPLPPLKFLPSDGKSLGGIMIVDEDDVNLCAGFIYETNSAVAWMEYIVSNPNIRDRTLRGQSINQLIEFLCEFSKQKGFEYIFTTVKNDNLINRYLNNGFMKGTVGSTEMIKIL